MKPKTAPRAPHKIRPKEQFDDLGDMLRPVGQSRTGLKVFGTSWPRGQSAPSQGYWAPGSCKTSRSCESSHWQRLRPGKAPPRIEKVASKGLQSEHAVES